MLIAKQAIDAPKKPGKSMNDVFEESETEAPTEGGLGIDFGIILVSLWRRWWWIALCTLVFTGLALFVATNVSPTYQARAILLKHNKNTSVNPDIYYEPNLRTILETVKLRENLEQLKNELALELSVEDLFKRIDVKQGHRNEIIQIVTTDAKPEQAAAMANQISEIFQASSAGISRSVARRVYQFRQAQKQALQKGLKEAQAKMRAFLTQHKISFYEASTNMLMEQLKQLELDLGNARIQKEKDRLRIREISQELGRRPETIRVTSTVRYRTRVKQEELQTELKGLLERYTEDNPKVIAVRQQIDAMGRQLSTTTEKDPEEESYGMDPVVRELKIEKAQLEAGLEGNTRQVGTLEKTIQGHRSQLTKLAAIEKEYENLKREIDVITENLRENEFKMAEAENAMKSNISNFDLVERARPPVDPLPTRRKLIVLAGLFVGLFGGTASVVLKEILDFRIKTARDLDKLNLEVLGTVPHRHQVDEARYYHHWLLTFQQLNLRLQQLKRPAFILVCSQDAGEGKSFLLEQILDTLQHKGDKLVYINSLTELTSERRPHALNNFLQHPDGLMPMLQTIEPGRQQLYFHLNQDSLKYPMISNKIERMLGLLKDADYIFWELPAFENQLHTASMLAAYADVALVISRFRGAKKSALKRALQTLNESQLEQVWGILNGVERAYQNV